MRARTSSPRIRALPDQLHLVVVMRFTRSVPHHNARGTAGRPFFRFQLANALTGQRQVRPRLMPLELDDGTQLDQIGNQAVLDTLATRAAQEEIGLASPGQVGRKQTITAMGALLPAIHLVADAGTCNFDTHEYSPLNRIN